MIAQVLFDHASESWRVAENQRPYERLEIKKW